MIGEIAAALFRRQAARLAAAAVARLGDRVARHWAGYGAVTRSDGAVRLLAPGVRRRRRGGRDALADADLLWPGGDGGERS